MEIMGAYIAQTGLNNSRWGLREPLPNNPDLRRLWSNVSEMEMAEKVGDMISQFVASLEDHPKGAELVTLVERVLAGEIGKVDSAVVAALKQLSNNNVALIVDFWILRGQILKEEGQDQAAIKTFMEAAQWEPTNVETWVRLVDMYVQSNEFLKAVFFLQEAQETLESSSPLKEIMEKIEDQLRKSFSYPPGIDTGKGTELPSLPVSAHLSSQETTSPREDPNSQGPRTSPTGRKSDRKIPEEVDKVWELAMECYEGAKGDNLVYRHAFVHYAHATVRELLGGEGKFADVLERKLAQYGLLEHQDFFKWLNHLRNKVVHEDYMPTREEVDRVYTGLSPLVEP